MQNTCHENDCCFFRLFSRLRQWREVCLRLQLHFRNVSGGTVVTVMAGQRPLATALCSHSYCSLDRSVFFCSANFVRTAGESNEIARLMSACRARQGCTALLSGKIGEKCSVGGFFFSAHGAPYRRWSRASGGCCLFACRFPNRMGCTAAVWPVPAPNRGAVLSGTKNQQDGLYVGAPCAPKKNPPTPHFPRCSRPTRRCSPAWRGRPTSAGPSRSIRPRPWRSSRNRRKPTCRASNTTGCSGPWPGAADRPLRSQPRRHSHF